MTMELSAKVQQALWWIASIAVSVICFSLLCVFFGGALSDVRREIRQNAAELSLLRDRQDLLMSELRLIRESAVFKQVQRTEDSAEPVGEAMPDGEPAAVSVSGTIPEKMPDATIVAPVVDPLAAEVTTTLPAVAVPSIAPQEPAQTPVDPVPLTKN